ncbi:hypothetical protein C8J56DRAFT_926298 [Mycena floridula]|nr:hypothetical protein C8J56DRAFT_926298 [Mycena floridula]
MHSFQGWTPPWYLNSARRSNLLPPLISTMSQPNAAHTTDTGGFAVNMMPQAPAFPGQPQQYAPPPGALNQQQYGLPSGPPPPNSQYPVQPGAPIAYGAFPVGPQMNYYLGTAVADPDFFVAIPGYDPRVAVEEVKKATKGFGCDEDKLIATLAPLNALQMDSLSRTYVATSGKSLLELLEKETSGNFRETLRALVLGPIGYDAHLVRQAVKGFGTNETALTEILLGRTAKELELLQNQYYKRYSSTLAKDVADDLSGDTKKLFTIALNQSSYPATERFDVESDVQALYEAGQGKKLGTDELKFCQLVVGRPREHLTLVCTRYAQKHKSLSKVIKSEFSGHIKTALLHVVNGAKQKRLGMGEGVHRDAKLLEKAMAGLGTKDPELIWRIVRAHWDPARFERIKAAYEGHHKKSLEKRVQGETSGDYRKLLLALIRGVPAPKK